MARSFSSLLSRSLLALSLAGTTTAIAAPQFAQPPPGAERLYVDYSPPSEVPENVVAPEYRVAPVVLTREKVRARLTEARERSIAAFHAYRTTSSYPSNTFTDGALNVWRDSEGRFCAAATILRVTGGMDMSERIASEDNNIKLANVTDGALMDWVLTSGLTQEELALIQRPFMPVTKRPPAVDQERQLDLAMKQKETKRLAALYAKIEAKVKKQSHASIETATNRLMANPELAKKLLAGPIHRV